MVVMSLIIPGEVITQDVSASESHHIYAKVEENELQTSSQYQLHSSGKDGHASAIAGGKQCSHNQFVAGETDINGSKNHCKHTKAKEVKMQMVSQNQLPFNSHFTYPVSHNNDQTLISGAQVMRDGKHYHKHTIRKKNCTHTTSQNELHSNGEGGHATAFVKSIQFSHDQTGSESAVRQDAHASKKHRKHTEMKEIQTQTASQTELYSSNKDDCIVRASTRQDQTAGDMPGTHTVGAGKYHYKYTKWRKIYTQTSQNFSGRYSCFCCCCYC